MITFIIVSTQKREQTGIEIYIQRHCLQAQCYFIGDVEDFYKQLHIQADIVLVSTKSLHQLPLLLQQEQHASIYLCVRKNDDFLPYHIQVTAVNTLFQRQRDIIMKQGNSFFPLDQKEIIFVESQRNNIFIHTIRTTHKLRSHIADMEKQLFDLPFIRCHQSYLINFDFLYSLTRYEIILQNGIKVPVSKKFSKIVRSAYALYKGVKSDETKCSKPS